MLYSDTSLEKLNLNVLHVAQFTDGWLEANWP